MKIKKEEVLTTLLNIAHDITIMDIPKSINLNSPVSQVYDDMCMDSLDEIETIMKLETHYQITLKDEDVVAYKYKTLDEFCGFVCAVIDAQHPTIESQKKSLSSKIKQLFQRTK